MEAALAQHMRECDRIDEFMFCIGCGEKVYLHDHSRYQGVGDDVLCLRCSVDSAAIDTAQMAFAEILDIEDVEPTLTGFTERAIERAAVANGISRKAVRLVLDL